MSDYPTSSKRVPYADENSDDDNVNEDYFEVSERDSVSEAEAHSEDERIEEIQSGNEKSSAESIKEMQTDSGENSEGSTNKSTISYGKSRYQWSSKTFISRTRTQKYNIIVQLPGVRPSVNLGNKADPVTCDRCS
ncbi:hypothetical protein QE152_g27377 [Popillia japonica]|uniref:Uncharacterized protein n=1 Tax=Popillia japonica TaxID=7064 RepID=A0AAW1JVR5_POPJA